MTKRNPSHRWLTVHTMHASYALWLDVWERGAIRANMEFIGQGHSRIIKVSRKDRRNGLRGHVTVSHGE